MKSNQIEIIILSKIKYWKLRSLIEYNLENRFEYKSDSVINFEVETENVILI